VNQTLVRSINTSIVALLPVLAIIIVGAGFLGAGTLLDLAVVLFIGMAAGTYSSIFIATPFLVQLKESQPEMKALAARVSARRKQGRTASSADAAEVADATAPVAANTASTITRTDSTTRQQPRKQPRSKRSKG
jgi:preprotein translocase subunit SecF